MADEAEPGTALALPAAEPTKAAPRADAISDAIDRWVAECVHNSPIARDVDVFNHLITTALPELRRRIQEIA